MLSRALVVVGLLLGLSSPAFAQYDDEVGGGSAVVIQNRKFKMAHEFTLEGGTLPLDAFVKGATLSGRYTLHFDDFSAWEIAGGTFSFNIDAGLKQQLIDRFGVQPQSFASLQLTVDSNYVMKPFYGKLALFNRTLIYAELFAVVGVTASYWSDNSWRPGPDVGVGARFFVTEWFSIRTDLRYAVVLGGVPLVDPNATIDGILLLAVGASFNVGY
jgi:outer membrane beta-barrel protein